MLNSSGSEMLDRAKMRVCIFIMGKMKVCTLIMGKMKVHCDYFKLNQSSS
jgi:hypothetical protein